MILVSGNGKLANELVKLSTVERPIISLLSATEEVLESVPSSIEAAEITKLAKE